jgi:hypothetical protein
LLDFSKNQNIYIVVLESFASAKKNNLTKKEIDMKIDQTVFNKWLGKKI